MMNWKKKLKNDKVNVEHIFYFPLEKQLIVRM